MKKPSYLVFLIVALVTFLGLTSPAQAGGWAVITLLELPEQVAPGNPVEIRFAVRGHGVSLMGGLTPTVYARNNETGERLEGAAAAERVDGYYRVSLNFPSPGKWEWSIMAYAYEQSMPALVVGDATSQTEQPLQGSAFMVAGVLLVFGMVLGWVRRSLRWLGVTVAAALIVGGAGLVNANAPNLETPPANTEPDLAVLGKDLFVAKGCVTCHNHEKAKNFPMGLSTNYGPDLTHFRADGDYLKRWLANPAAIKPGVQMPDLELNEKEIDALIAFLNQPVDVTKKASTGLEDCPVTKPPDPAYAPPLPYPAEYPYEGMAWYGSDNLWTAIPIDGQWGQLARGEKVFWWSAGYENGIKDPSPALTISARRLDHENESVMGGRATNAYNPDFEWAMLTGVSVTEYGCWEINGQYGKSSLSFIVRVEP